MGYALVHVRGPEETWATGDRIAVLETLAVLPGHRSRGIGGARRFYERQGLLPFTVSYLGRVPRAATR